MTKSNIQETATLRSILVAMTILAGLAALSGPAGAATFGPGNITTAQTSTDQVNVMINATNSAAGTISLTDTGNQQLFFQGVCAIYTNISLNHASSYIANVTYGSFTPYQATQYGGLVDTAYFYQKAGTYTLVDGTLNVGGWFGVQGGQLIQNGGTIQGGGFGTGVSWDGAPGASTLTLNAGRLTTPSMLVGNVSTANSGRYGVVVQESASTVSVTGSGTGDNSPFRISQANASGNGESSYTLKGGSFTVNAGDTKIYAYGKLAGYGTVTTSSARTLDNSGKVVADGYGSDVNVLNLSQYGTVLNSTENGTERTGAGWYAQNHGKLTLPSFVVAGGSSTKTWGESTGDTTIDLVNSARLAFSGVTGGTVAMSLLAADRTDVPANPYATPIGVWDVDGSAFTFGGGSVALTLRYDNALVSDPSRLALFHYTGGQWQQLATTLDSGNFLVSAAGITSFSEFEVGSIPEPSTMLLLGLGGLFVWRKVRNRK